MSLIISNKVTDKQRELLRKLEYHGDFNLTVTQAATLIDELIAQQKQELKAYNDQFEHDYIEYNGEHYDIF